MKKTLALAAVLVAVLAPSGTAFAAEPDTGGGNSYGNCGNTGKGGMHDVDLYANGAGKGFGGHVLDAKDPLAPGCKGDGGGGPVTPMLIDGVTSWGS